MQNDEIEVYTDQKYGIVIVSFSSRFDLIYHPTKALPLKDIAQHFDYRYVMNGSFFEGDRLNAKHAGWLSILGMNHSLVKEDPQLSHVVRYDPSSEAIEFLPLEEFNPLISDNYIEFQTGPLIIRNNKLAEKYIKESINGLGDYKRALLAYTNDQQKYFIITKEVVSLDDLGEYLLTLPIFSGKIFNAINLDGGPSVALYSKDYPELNYNEEDRLPILLTID
ncbi:phosphodiester glycosidase family protein [Spirulina sp. 06S082]|uniref:phosphodiester glycosidase family protein n=1 Tax=Spirulina sp. 06S082 TaxID=3110248 RepID=UPI002B20728D|nr:phosphodiester glycosidase family protein [Spirulina sp. 06S082]MEA5471496.1 phosphodiester glycosidase family protein [Spirulina sp. 06S082]